MKIDVEAIYENLEAKRSLYAGLEPRMKAGALLGTNTSSSVLEVVCRAARCMAAPVRRGSVRPAEARSGPAAKGKEAIERSRLRRR